MHGDITKKDIENWARNQHSTLIGRAYDSSKKEDREAFADWFYGVLGEIRRSKPPME